jgi:hypothetical protein
MWMDSFNTCSPHFTTTTTTTTHQRQVLHQLAAKSKAKTNDESCAWIAADATGRCVGALVGNEGDWDGWRTGETLGLLDCGLDVGACEGRRLGETLGRRCGEAVGVLVGDLEGLEEMGAWLGIKVVGWLGEALGT